MRHASPGSEPLSGPIQIRAALRQRLTQHAEQAYPLECCGVLLGRRAPSHVCVEDIRKAGNISQDDRAVTYQLDWKTLFDAVRTTRHGPLVMVGFYHSHPDAPPTPSNRDRRDAWPNRSYLIIAVETGRATKLASWRIEPPSAEFQPESIEWC